MRIQAGPKFHPTSLDKCLVHSDNHVSGFLDPPINPENAQGRKEQNMAAPRRKEERVKCPNEHGIEILSEYLPEAAEESVFDTEIHGPGLDKIKTLLGTFYY
jgi:hypothetical protein